MTVIANTTKTILISVDLSELRVAVLEEGRTVETYIERRGAGSIAGNIYKAKIDNILPAIDAAFVDFGAPKNGFLQVRDVVVPGLSATARRRKKISDMLSNGQDILVQIEKNPMKTKGARVTMELSIAGRFLVLTPDGEGSGVSKRLPDGERERLRKLVKQLETDGVGVIARTAAAGATLEDLERDLRFLRKIWAQVQARAKAAPTKTLVHQDGDLSLRVIRDLLTRNVDKVVVDSERQYRRILGWVRTTQPEFADRIELHTGSQPLFEQYGVEAAIRSTLNRRVDLPSGGYLLFDYAEAFTVIDVNSGSSTRQSHLEETTLRTNVEAAREVLRQLRLRDIGGIIVIDFIDLERERNRKELLAVLTEELTKDRTKTYLVDISPLGLVEMTRQNTTEGVRETLTSICPTCGGEGRVLSQDTMAVEAERKLRKLAHASLVGGVPDPAEREGGGQAGRPRRRQAARAGARDRPLLHARGRDADAAGGGGRGRGGHAPRGRRSRHARQGRRRDQAADRRAAHVQPVRRRRPAERLPGDRGRRDQLRGPGAQGADRPRHAHHRLRHAARRQAGADRAAAGAG